MGDKGTWSEGTWAKVEAYAPKLKERLRAVGNPQEAQDAVQETVRLMLEASHKGLAEPKNVPGYMTMVGKNIIRDDYRKHHDSQTRKTRMQGFGSGETYCQFFANLHDDSLDAATAVEAQEILRLVDNLDDGKKRAFRLRFVDGLSFKEISDSMGIPENTAKTTVHRAREQLKKQLEIPSRRRDI